MPTCYPRTPTGPGGRGCGRAGLPGGGGGCGAAAPGQGKSCVCGVCRRECGCARPTASLPPAPHVLFTRLSHCDGTVIFIACAFRYIYKLLRGHTKSPGTPTRARFTEPPRKKLRFRCGFGRLGKVGFGIRRGTQVPLPFRKTACSSEA